MVGLGNPGPRYRLTRHNVGFMLADLLLTSDFKDASSNKFQGELYKFNDLLILKPSTFMNLSGQSVKAVANFYKPQRIIVVHDDLDLGFGVVKFKKGGGSGGHNGLKSIDSLIGSDYERIRIGIGRGDFNGESAVTDHVLGEFSAEEKDGLEKILDYSLTAAKELLKSDIETVSQKFSTKKGIL